MEKISQTSRRNFMGTLALFSAGAAIGGNNLLPLYASTPDIRKNWEEFCRQFGGKTMDSFTTMTNQLSLNSCTGHFHESGRLVYFQKEQYVAEPTWIFWSRATSRPSDLVVTFYENKKNNRKIGRLNRFEIEALTLHLAGQKNHTVGSGLASLLEKKIQVRTMIKKQQDLRLSMMVGQKEIILQQKTFSNI